MNVTCVYALPNIPVEWWKEDIEKGYERALMEGEFLRCDDVVDD